MKDMLKSKWMITFIVLVLVMTFIDSCSMAQKNASAENTDKINYIQK